MACLRVAIDLFFLFWMFLWLFKLVPDNLLVLDLDGLVTRSTSSYGSLVVPDDLMALKLFRSSCGFILWLLVSRSSLWLFLYDLLVALLDGDFVLLSRSIHLLEIILRTLFVVHILARFMDCVQWSFDWFSGLFFLILML